MIWKQRVGTEIGLVTGRIKRSWQNGKSNLSDIKTTLREKTRRAARKTDYYVHDNAWRMMALSAGVAFAAGFLLSRLGRRAAGAESRGEVTVAAERSSRPSRWEFAHGAIPLALVFVKAIQAARCSRKGLA